MRRALVLARPHLARAWPNPTVGAVVVRDRECLGQGVHLGPGHPHAEVAAIAAAEAAGHSVRGSTVYVTLEPCHHQGRTPPCTRTLLGAGVGRVVYAVADDNPRVPGGGGAFLRERGLDLRTGVLGRVAWELNHPFFETPTDREVHWTLKLALGLDGTLAPGGVDLSDPRARRITGALAHRRAHRLRGGARAVVVGSRTIRLDRPRLDLRHLSPDAVAGPGPRPVVLDSGAALGPEELPARALVFHASDRGSHAVEEDREWVRVDRREDGRLAWPRIAQELADRGLGLVLVEGGAAVAADLLDHCPPQRIHLLIAPRGWKNASVRLPLAVDLDRDYRRVRVRPLGPDVEWVFQRRDLPEGPGNRQE